MFQILGDLFRGSDASWREEDIKYFIQDYLRGMAKSEGVYCQHVKDGVATVRVDTPTMQQEIHLLEYDLKQAVAEKTQYTLKSLKILR